MLGIYIILHLCTWFHSMQLALVVWFLPSTGADTVLAPGQLALVVFFLPPTSAETVFALGQLALCGGGLLVVVLYYIIYSFFLFRLVVYIATCTVYTTKVSYYLSLALCVYIKCTCNFSIIYINLCDEECWNFYFAQTI